jgi:gliding motility-associated-like protein
MSLIDTTYALNNQNTKTQQHNFFVELWSYGSSKTLVSQAVKSSSVFLNLNPSDRMIELNWNSNVAWREDSFIIHRKAPNESSYTALYTLSGQTYLDTSLINKEDYCYYIESRGSYNLSSVNLPLINFSQVVCDQPIDNIPPCPPIFTIESDCENDDLKILWKKGEGACEEDLQAYRIYYSPTLEGKLELIAEVSGSVYEFSPDLAKNSGCYSVVAVDTVGNTSETAEKICRDYCPYFELPNIFTPNGDGINDLFEPIPPNNNTGTPNYRDVDSIDLKIYNRWQQLVFETHKPEVKWGGFHQEEEKMLKDGVYYYLCVVYERSLIGIKSRTIQGTVTLRDGDKDFNGTYK